ncbi:MAG TPA: HigA family addiction module antitoxin [Fulvivirga sp.]|nr:HigA family addiction module antitoxin [Fulvivirga sp.]
MYNPVHPGRIIRDDYLEPIELTTGALAKALGVTRQTMAAILNERSGVSPEMALRLTEAFDTTPFLWITLQRNYDLKQASMKFVAKKNVTRLYSNSIT